MEGWLYGAVPDQDRSIRKPGCVLAISLVCKAGSLLRQMELARSDSPIPIYSTPASAQIVCDVEVLLSIISEPIALFGPGSNLTFNHYRNRPV